MADDIFTKLGLVKLSDFWRGLIVAVATAPLTIIYEAVTKGGFGGIDWSTVGGVAIAGGVGYILKNLATGEGGKILSNDK